MTTITISRQMGSLGMEVAREVSARLGYRLIWRDVINQASRRSRSPEAALAAIDELGLLGISPSPKANQAYRLAIEQVMNELAQEGNIVIVGRAGQAILHSRPDVLHVRMIAPLDMRIDRIARLQDISPDQAQAQIETSDRSRQRYVRRFYSVRWDNPELYHLVLNTGFLTTSTAADMIIQASASLVANPSPAVTTPHRGVQP